MLISDYLLPYAFIFLIWPILGASANINRKKGLLFGRFEDTKIPFLD